MGEKCPHWQYPRALSSSALWNTFCSCRCWCEQPSPLATTEIYQWSWRSGAEEEVEDSIKCRITPCVATLSLHSLWDEELHHQWKDAAGQLCQQHQRTEGNVGVTSLWEWPSLVCQGPSLPNQPCPYDASFFRSPAVSLNSVVIPLPLLRLAHYVNS